MGEQSTEGQEYTRYVRWRQWNRTFSWDGIRPALNKESVKPGWGSGQCLRPFPHVCLCMSRAALVDQKAVRCRGWCTPVLLFQPFQLCTGKYRTDTLMTSFGFKYIYL